MPEHKEKPAEISKFVEDSTTRLHDMERRLQTLQSGLANLTNLAATLQQTPPTTPMAPPGARESFSPFGPNPPSMNPFGSGFPQGPFYAQAPVAGPYPQGARGGMPRLGSNLLSPWSGGPSLPVGEPMTGRDLEKLPAIRKAPECNLVDAGDNFVLQFELPGVRKEDLEITASERSVTVHADGHSDAGDGTVLLGELTPVSYRRTVHLPAPCNVAQAKATVKDGCLTLRVPKREPTETPRKLDVAYT